MRINMQLPANIKTTTANNNFDKLHYSVMLTEAIDGLNIKPHGLYVDGTFGCGGHSKAILSKLSGDGRLLIIDLDLDAIKKAYDLQLQDPRLMVFHGSFVNLKEICQQFNILNIDGILLDLGVSSAQLDDPDKGFSFSRNGPLDMRMNNTRGLSASEWLKNVTQHELTHVLKEYGQEPFAKKIAAAIINCRVIKPIETTFDLVKIIQEVYSGFYVKHKHPATRTFQAIRIFINQELLNLQQALPEIIKLLNIKGRLVVISFHSLEDIIVKKFIKDNSKSLIFKNSFLRKVPNIDLIDQQITLKNLGKFKPSKAEIIENRRSRSAIMRVSEKCA